VAIDFFSTRLPTYGTCFMLSWTNNGHVKLFALSPADSVVADTVDDDSKAFV